MNYCDLEERTEFRLARNLPETGEFAASNEEIGDFYRNRWQIELLWKFLKMDLKLDRLITKNTNEEVCVLTFNTSGMSTIRISSIRSNHF